MELKFIASADGSELLVLNLYSTSKTVLPALMKGSSKPQLLL